MKNTNNGIPHPDTIVFCNHQKINNYYRLTEIPENTNQAIQSDVRPDRVAKTSNPSKINHVFIWLKYGLVC